MICFAAMIWLLNRLLTIRVLLPLRVLQLHSNVHYCATVLAAICPYVCEAGMHRLQSRCEQL